VKLHSLGATLAGECYLVSRSHGGRVHSSLASIAAEGIRDIWCLRNDGGCGKISGTGSDLCGRYHWNTLSHLIQ
jgi:hypothetical protein